jgi:hypothetical protein
MNPVECGTVTRRRRVEEHPYVIDIRQLKKAGYLIPGKRTAVSFDEFEVQCNLDSDEAYICIRLPSLKLIQFVKLVSRAAGRGKRWFFREGATGIDCEKLYLCNAAFAPRQTAGLAYESQLKTKVQRQHKRADKLHDAIVGTAQKGPARGRLKISKKEELARLTKSLRKYRAALARRA